MTAQIVAPRTAAEAVALALAEDVPTWHRGRSKVDGTPFYLAPSRTVPGQAHRCTSYGCTCKGFERYGQCAHSRAVQIAEAREHKALGLASDAEIDCGFAGVAADHEWQAEAERQRRSEATWDRLFPADDFD